MLGWKAVMPSSFGCLESFLVCGDSKTFGLIGES